MSNTLKIKDEKFQNSSVESSNLFCRTIQTEKAPCKSGRFSFIQNYSVKTVPKKNITYREPKIVQGKRWYVEYYYRDPSGKWQRFRVLEDINRHKTLEYATLLRDAVSLALAEGYNPFGENHLQVKTWSAQQAVLFFKQKWQERGLEATTLSKYNTVADRFMNWLQAKGKQHSDITGILKPVIEAYLSECKKSLRWSNRSYNNERNFLKTIFGFFESQKLIDQNPCVNISLQKVSTQKHKFYSDKLLKEVLDWCRLNDPYLGFAFLTVYYLCLRSEKELKLFKIGNIFPERKQVLITAKESKTDADRFIPMPDEMLRIFEERKILGYPADHYVFSSAPMGTKGIIDWHPGEKPFGKEFFSKRFRRLRKALGLSSDYTIYGAKHTRVIHLKLDGVQDQDIMNLTGHKDYGAFSEYMRDLGLTANPDEVNKKTRKF